MKDEEIKEMVAGLLKELAQAADQRQQEADLRHEASTREADRRRQEADLRHEASTREADRRQQEADRRQQEADRRQQKADQRHQETESLIKELARASDRRQAKLDRQLKALRDNIGGLSNKFGSFTEALASPSLERLLTETFGMEFVDLDVRRRRGSRRTQIDALAHSNTGRDAVYVVEVKSRLKDEGVDQMLKILGNFFHFFPEHRGKKLYAVLAAVEAPDELRSRVLDKGIYMAQISDDIFQIKVPEGFKPRSFAQSVV